MATQFLRGQIRFADGRTGTQQRTVIDGESTLDEIVVLREKDGTRCRYIYGPRRFLQDQVFSFSDLGNTTWELAGPETEVK